MHKKTGYPNEGECLFCTVTKVQYNSVFVNLDEYDRKSGMIHISEVSPGRIRNINDYVKEGKVVICKVLRINRERGHIDLSLRRVNESQRRAKIDERKHQAIAENIIKSYSQLHNLELQPIYDVIANVILETYSSLYAAFEDVVENEASLTDAGLDKSLADELERLVRERIKPKQVEIEGTLILTSYEPNGVDIINNLMAKVVKLSDHLSTLFLGAGRFKISVVAPEYAVAEKVFTDFEDLVKENIKGTQTEYSFERV